MTSAEGAELTIQWDDALSSGGAKGVVQLQSGDVLVTRTRWGSNEVSVVCSRSRDGGRTWEDFSIITTAEGGTDLGDGDLRQLSNGDVLYSFRQISKRRDGIQNYSIRVVQSSDGGKIWRPHSVVAKSRHDANEEPEALRGLWSSFLLERSDGVLQCYYDDEETPHQAGFTRHQWLTMTTWDAAAREWKNPVTVSRAHDTKHLSRDGMVTVVEVATNRLVAVFESVQVEAPHANCVRMVTSDDGGATWSWRTAERAIVFQPRKKNFMAVSPWVTRVRDEMLICVFVTDEDRQVADKPATHPRRMNMDVKYVLSPDGGRTWSSPAGTVFDKTHRSYAPGVVALQDGTLLVTFMDFAGYGSHAVRGRIADRPRSDAD